MNAKKKTQSKFKSLKSPKANLAVKAGKIKEKLKKANKDRKSALNQLKDWRKDPDVKLSSVQWHQISDSLGGIYIFREFDITDRAESDNPENGNGPFDVLAFDEMSRKFGEQEADEMASACRELPLDDQIAVAKKEIEMHGAKSATKSVLVALAAEGIRIKLLK